ncbi:MAG: DUF3106 domain-containing protein [Opitutae bacterium]|nr:DUF3106 domain-containing protein [Opitutae bacterium]
MKTFIPILVLTLLLNPGVLRAAEPVPASPPPVLPAGKELATLDQFLDLSDEDLDQMQQVIARIRAMSPAEKTALRREMDKFRSLPENQRRQLRQGWGAIESGLQDAWRRMMQSATPERHAEIQAQLQALPPEKKADYRRRLAEEFLRQEAGK